MHIGLTGGIGSGKSTVGQFLVRAGAWLVDTDAIARELTQPGGRAMPEVARLFGADYVDATGALDRARMRERVFRDPAARSQLEGLLHPLIGQEAVDRASRAAPGQTVVFDVPLLVESGRWRRRVDRVLVVDCTPATQVKRVVQRSGLSPEEVERIIGQQAPRGHRLAAADAVICNEGVSLCQLEAEAASLWALWHRP